MLDLMVGALRSAGLGSVDAFLAAKTVYLFVLAAAIDEQSTEAATEGSGELLPDPTLMPELNAALPEVDFDPDRYFEHGLGTILDGLKARRN